MKFILFALTTLLTVGSSKSNAQDVSVSAAVINSFNATFKNASEVQWKDGGDYFKAEFNLNGQYVTAFYNANATLKAVTKNISSIQLPVTLQTNLKASYEDYWVSELFEVSDEAGTTYYATVENGEAKITLKSSGGYWTTYKKSRKA
jgi:post-segregation antitoxin (ccd killing protein)